MVRRERHISESRPLAHKGFEEAGLRTHLDGDSRIVDKNPSRWGCSLGDGSKIQEAAKIRGYFGAGGEGFVRGR